MQKMRNSRICIFFAFVLLVFCIVFACFCIFLEFLQFLNLCFAFFLHFLTACFLYFFSSSWFPRISSSAYQINLRPPFLGGEGVHCIAGDWLLDSPNPRSELPQMGARCALAAASCWSPLTLKWLAMMATCPGNLEIPCIEGHGGRSILDANFVTEG